MEWNFFHCSHNIFFYKFQMACTYLPPKIWWQIAVQAWSILFGLPPFWRVFFFALNHLFLRILNDLFYKTIPNNAEFIFMEKEILKIKHILLSLKTFPLLIEWLSKYGSSSSSSGGNVSLTRFENQYLSSLAPCRSARLHPVVV